MLTLRSGGWVLLLAGLFTVGLFLWAVAGAFVRDGGPLTGDGRNVETYGFSLEPCLVPRDLLVAGGVRKDAIRALFDPPVISGDEVARINAERYGKYLVSTDRVIGVSINGASRAYPLQIMQVHEIANDVLAGIPIAVTYNPLCDSTVVFDRTVDGEVLDFGVSGLLYNSNLLMYDRRPEAAGESLWSQLMAEAIAGPAAGQRLRVMDAAVTTWSDWLRLHPDSTVLQRDERLERRYKETTFDLYFHSSQIRFPVRPAPPPDGPAPKQRVVVVTAGDARGVFPFDTVARHAGPDGTWRTILGTVRLRLEHDVKTDTVTVTARPGSEPITAIYAMWFAWHAMHPDDEVSGETEAS